MPGPNLLWLSFAANGGEIRKHTVVDARTYRGSRSTGGERAVLAAMSLLGRPRRSVHATG
jgi:hypothetical protein